MRTYPFLITLPVSTHQLYLARTLSILTLLWAPAIISTSIFGFLGPEETTATHLLLAISGISTFIVFFIQTIRPKEFAAPLSSLSLIILPFLWLFAGHILPILTVLYLSLGASALLFLWNWLHLPSSFELASKAQAREYSPNSHSEASHKELPAGYTLSALKPVLRSIFDIPCVFMLLLLILGTSGGLMTSISMLVLATWTYTRQRMCWLNTLPLPSRLALSLICAPIFLSITIGCILSSRMHPMLHSLRILTLYSAACIGIALLSILVIQLFFWRKFPLLSDPWRLIAMFVPFLLIYGFSSWSAFDYGRHGLKSLPWRLSRSLPENPFLMILLVLAALAGLYWINIKLFREAECIEVHSKLAEIEARRIYAG
jgi:NADH:ubiquinone oxidoreductase subunit 3 (subunit A)